MDPLGKSSDANPKLPHSADVEVLTWKYRYDTGDIKI
jgi:hypothetical protein